MKEHRESLISQKDPSQTLENFRRQQVLDKKEAIELDQLKRKYFLANKQTIVSSYVTSALVHVPYREKQRSKRV